MKRISFIIVAIFFCTMVHAVKKVDPMDENKWQWTEWADQYSSVSFDEGYMVINYKKAPKPSKEVKALRKKYIKFLVKYKDEIQRYAKEGNNEAIEKLCQENGFTQDFMTSLSGNYLVRTFAKLPIRAEDNYKITIHYLSPVSFYPIYSILFNGNKDCLNDFEDEQNKCTHNSITVNNQAVNITYLNNDNVLQQKSDQFPVKITKEMPMTLTIEKKNNKAIIELNGIELLRGDCLLKEPCIGFQLFSPKQTLKIDEIIIEQNDEDSED